MDQGRIRPSVVNQEGMASQEDQACLAQHVASSQEIWSRFSPFTIVEELGTGAYRLELPNNSPYSDRINADRLEKWVDSDFTVFPTHSGHPQHALLPPHTQVEPVHHTIRYLLRDYSLFPAASVRYWVQTDSVSTPFVWIDGTSYLLEEFLSLEGTNGCIPETGITQNNFQHVKQHKQEVYLQSPAPIMVNTWTSSHLPMQVRKRPRFKPPADLPHAVVQDLFHVTDDKSEFYQGTVIQKHDKRCRVQWTDGYESTHTVAEIQTMLYDPISYIYDFNHA
eukprot:scaffold313_cov378-Pavlova_lutheri.AAC.11